MEKVKAHDRYKHICYWVLRLLYFDSLVSTQVGSFDSIPLRYLAWILICFLQHSHLALYLANVQCTSTKAKTLLFDELQLQVVCLWHWDVQGGTISWVFDGGVQYRPTKAHNSDDTQRMLGIITLFCLFKSLKLKFIQCDFFSFLEFIDFYHNVHLCKHCKICKLIKSHTKKS